MGKVTIDELKEKQKILEEKILMLVNDFETATGTHVENIYFTEGEIMGSGKVKLAAAINVTI